MSELDRVTDLFPSDTKPPITRLKVDKMSEMPVVAPALAKEKRVTTQDFYFAVALICAGWPAPDLEITGYSRRGKPRAAFAFNVPLGQSARAMEDKYLRNEIRAEVKLVFSTSQSLKARIYHLIRDSNVDGKAEAESAVAESAGTLKTT